MKTPKEILLQRHSSIESKLNAVRQKAVASLDRPGIVQSWRIFVFSLRWHLAGISAVWMAVLFLNLENAPGSAGVLAQDRIPSARVLAAALLKNRRELIELTEGQPAIEPAALPRRRSQIPSRVEIV